MAPKKNRKLVKGLNKNAQKVREIEDPNVSGVKGKSSKRKEATAPAAAKEVREAKRTKRIQESSNVDAKSSKKSRKRGVGYDRLHHRSCVKLITEAANHMSDEQKKAVESIGLGKLLRLPFSEIPRFLGLWSVQNYDARRGLIEMADDTALPVTEQDVEICLGLPRGPNQIVKKAVKENKELVDEWREHIGQKDRLYSSRPSHLFEAMFFKEDETGVMEDKESRDARKQRYSDDIRWFIRDFCILVWSCMIEPHQSGAINQNMILPLGVIADMQSYNWCRFVISCLNEAKDKWVKKPDNALFTGCIYFLTIHYLDRVVNYRQRDVEVRSIPAFVGWDDAIIRKREDLEMNRGGFGRGLVEEQQTMNRVLIDEPRTKESSPPTKDASKEGGGIQDGQSSQDRQHNEDFNISFGQAFRNLLKDVIIVSDIMKNIPDVTNKVSITIAEGVKSIFSAKSSLSQVTDSPTQFGKVLSNEGGNAWTDEELDKVMIDYESALKKRDDMVYFDLPDLFGIISADISPIKENVQAGPSGLGRGMDIVQITFKMIQSWNPLMKMQMMT